MGKFRLAPCIFTIAAATVLCTNPAAVHAAPIKTNYNISVNDLDIQGKIIYTAAEEVASPFYKKGISMAEDCVMIRREPSTDSEAVGKLYGGAGFEVLGKVDGWIHIRSGACEGYVSEDYVVTGKDAEQVSLSMDAISSYAKVLMDNVEIKASASDASEVLATLGADDVIDVISAIPGTDWTKVKVDGTEGYVKNQSVEVGVNYESAITMEEDEQRQAEIEAQTGAGETQHQETSQQTTEETTASQEQQTESYIQETEAPVQETEAPQEQQTESYVEETEAPSQETEVNYTPLYIQDVWETVWTTDAVNVRADADFYATRLDTLSEGTSITRTGICENGWSRVDYNGTTAYIHSDYLTTTEPVKEEPVYDNSSSNSALGQQIVDFARQFLGNPYVYGGTSLTNGADCSGFVQSVYANFGYSLPRTCTTQSVCGRGVSVDELQPGDLIVYSYYGEIEHIAIYSGNGNIIHASNWDTGIIETSMYYSGDIYCCRRIVD